MVEAKTIGITAILLSGLITSGFIGANFFDKPVYYCESRQDIGFKYCDTLSKYGVENSKCNIDKTYYICKTGWVQVVEDRQITVIEEKPNQYSCSTDGCTALS